MILPCIGEAPPAIGQTKGEIDPTAGYCAFQEDQLSARLQQFTHMAQGDRQILGGMEHIGGNQQVGLTRRKALWNG